jgi:Undecaprenyl-phosphate glucose phosphotransferase
MVMVGSAWILAWFLRFNTFIETPKGIPDPWLYFKLLPFILVIWFFVFAASGFYRRTGQHRSAFIEALDIFQTCVFATIAFLAFSYFYEEYRYSRIALLVFAVIHPWMIITGRSLIRKALRIYRRRAPPRVVLVIGSGQMLERAINLGGIAELTRGDIMGVVLAGDETAIAEGREICNKLGIKVWEPQADWPGFFVTHPVQSILVALPYRCFALVEGILEQISDQVPDIKLLPDITKFTKFAAGIEIVSGTPVISIHDSPLAGMGSVAKRLMDVVGALVGFVVFGPVMLLMAVLVPLTSRGPIFYRQERMGLDGRTFNILKFRSMPVNAEAKTGAVWAKAGDGRPTWLGNIMRRTSIDELPQLFNILMGDMSLVGPRPERPVFVEQFRRKVPGYMLRHKVKAGLTGWAQVNGWRGDTSIERRIECDLFYIQNWSLWLDIRIIFLTVLRGFINKNAY